MGDERGRSIRIDRAPPNGRWRLGIVFVVAFLCSCSRSDLNWTEDILLPDGRTISITRHQEYERRYSWEEFGNGDYWFEFKNPDTGKPVRWTHDRGLGTVALMIDGGSPYLLTTIADGHGRETYQNPNPPYLLFRYEAGTWKQLALKEIPAKRVRSNMTDTGFTARKRVGANGSNLSADVTRASCIDEKPWVVDFDLLKEQTFGSKNRHVPANLLIADSQQSCPW
jgi:hypothetical protein